MRAPDEFLYALCDLEPLPNDLLPRPAWFDFTRASDAEHDWLNLPRSLEDHIRQAAELEAYWASQPWRYGGFFR